MSGGLVEDARAGRSAARATAIDGDIPPGEVIPITLDQRGAALMTIGALAGGIVDVAGIDVAQAVLAADAPRHAQRGGWGRRLLAHLPVRMKCGEMQGHIWTEMLHDPAAQRLYLRRRIVLAGNEQCRDLEPDVGLMLQIDQSI